MKTLQKYKLDFLKAIIIEERNYQLLIRGKHYIHISDIIPLK